MSNELLLARLATQLVAGMGVSKILGDIIKNNVVIVTPMETVAVKVGSLVLGSMLVEHSSNHITQQIDTVSDWWKSRKETIEEVT
jgi:hypothetical protein